MRRILLLKLTICLFSICFLLGNETAWGQKRDGYLKTDIRDLVLIYQGGVQRMDWNIEHIRPYVVHENRFGKRDWLFDGFLFLEFDSGKGVSFEARNNAPLAKKEDWLWLVDRHFEKGKGIDALNTCINEEISKLGKPSFKHQLVISLLQPVEGQKDWGEIDGKKLDFSKEEDQLEACKWYISQLMKQFDKMENRQIELAGFYWIPETMLRNKGVVRKVADYIHNLGLKFYWIPYYTAWGYSEWKELGFDAAYLQPTFFWNPQIKDNRLDRACELARTYGMGLEMEFDGAAMVNSKKNLRNQGLMYMDAFRRNGVFRNSALAYYEGGGSIYRFSRSDVPEDKQFIDTLAYFIQKRRTWLGPDFSQNKDFTDSFDSKELNKDYWNKPPRNKAIVCKKGKILMKGEAQINTKGKRDMFYGRIEVTARINTKAKNAEATIRMMPVEGKLGEWPNSGDMQLMRYQSEEGNRIHIGANTKQMNVTDNRIKESIYELSPGYHTFACEWSEQDIIFTVDGITVNIQEDLFQRANNPYYPQGWPFNNEPFYLEIMTSGEQGETILEIDSVKMFFD